MREVERAKADGRWDAAYASQANAAIPPELERRFRKSAKARKFFESLDSRNRYSVLHRIATAKKPETRERKAEQFFEMLKNGETIYPPGVSRPGTPSNTAARTPRCASSARNGFASTRPPRPCTPGRTTRAPNPPPSCAATTASTAPAATDVRSTTP